MASKETAIGSRIRSVRPDRKVSLRDLRYDFASRLVMADVNLRQVQLLMGHKSLQTTCRHAHLAPKDLLDAVEQLCPPSVLGKHQTDTSTSTKRKARSATTTKNVA